MNVFGLFVAYDICLLFYCFCFIVYCGGVIIVVLLDLTCCLFILRVWFVYVSGCYLFALVVGMFVIDSLIDYV